MNTSASTTAFTDRSDVFLERVYGNALGQLRAEQLIADLEEFLQQHQEVRSILDIGAGHAPVTLTLLARHPELTACLVDPSRDLLEQAEGNRQQFGIYKDRLQIIQGELSTVLHDELPCDLIICHAVANWTLDPTAFLRDLIELGNARGAWVSLVVGARRAKALRFANQGNMAHLKEAVASLDTPVGSLLDGEKVIPLDPDVVVQQIESLGNEIVMHAGVRIFADYVPPAVLRDDRQWALLKEAEYIARRDDRYWKLGQLIHLLFHRR